MTTLNYLQENKANENLSGLAETSKKYASDTVGKVEKTAHELGNKMGAAYGDVSDSVRSYVKTTTSYIEENPMKSMSIALAAGALIGSVMSRSLKSKN